MGKQKPKYNFDLEDALGGPSLSQDPNVQAAKAEQALRASQDTLSSNSIIKPTTQFLQHDKDVYESYLEPGQFDGSPTDLDYRVAENQSVTRQMVNGLGRLLPLTATKLAGTINSTKQAIEYALGNKNVFDDSEVSDGINQWETQIKDAMPIYATQKYNEGSLLEQMGTAKFWADDVGDGVAFLAAQFLGTKGLGAGLGAVGRGAGYLAKGAEGIELLSKVPGAAKVANAIANNYTAVTAGIVNAGFSGALQAQDTATQIKEGLAGKVNPRTGSEYTEPEIRAIAAQKAADTFNATFLVHILPGIWESKIFLGLNKAKLGDLRQGIMEAVNSGEIKLTDLLTGVGNAAVMKSAGKEALKGIAEGAAIEGLWEENIEQSIQNYDVKTGLNDQQVGVGERALNYGLGLISNLGVKNDAKAVVLGMILGGPMGGISKYASAKNYNERMPEFINTLNKSDVMYQRDVQGIYKTHAADVVDSSGQVTAKKGSIILDDQGNPIEDPEKLKNLTFQVMNQKALWDQQTVATFTGNTDMASLNENMALSSAVFRELATASEDGDTAGALDFLKWRVKKQLEEQENEQTNKDLNDQATKQAAEVATDESAQGDIEASQAATQAKSDASRFNGKDKAQLSRAINASLAKLDTFADQYKLAETQARKLNKIGQTPNRMMFNNVVQKGLFYESIKRESFDDMIRDRQEQLKDPLADAEKIASEIATITKLKDDSIAKSKAYLNDTDSVYNAWAGPQAKYGSLLEEADKTKAKSAAETDPTKRSSLDRQHATAVYQLNEMADAEGFTDIYQPVQNEEIISRPIFERSDKPVGSRNRFFWNAGNDFSKMAELNNKIDSYNENKLSLSDVLNYAKESITHLDSETSKRLNSLVTTERERLAGIEDQLANTEETLYSEPDEDGDTDYLGTNPEFSRLLDEKKKAEENIAEATDILANKQEAAEMNMINHQPQNIERHLVRQFALKHFDKGKYVLRNALDENGQVKEDYFDRDMVNRAIKDLTNMRNALQDRMEDGDLQGTKGLNDIIKDADRMLDRLYSVREQAELNRNNREGQQAAINISEATTLINGIGWNDGVITNSELFSAVDAVMDGTLGKVLKDIDDLTANHYEATMALFHKIQTKATEGQLGKIYDQLQLSSNASQMIIKDLLGTKGVNGFIVKGFGQNPRQMFPQAWINLSHQNAENGYERITNGKGSIFNQFMKNNDVDAMMAKVDNMPDDTKELGMPKQDFISLITAYKQALAAEKIQKSLETKIKPIVQSELKSAEQETLAPTTQQDISIREGIGWLQRANKSTQPFQGWAFLRGIAGTGKTNVVLKWILNNSGIDKADVMTTALTQTATDVAGASTGTQSMLFDKIEAEGLPSNIKLLIIDEYGTIGERRLSAFEEKIREARKNGYDVKVLMLGDPTQITPRIQNNDDINNIVVNPNAASIEIINPLTVVYRSDVSAVNEASDLFQDNNRPVGPITVRADRDLSIPLAKGVHTSSAATLIPEIISANIKAEQENKSTPRSRAIIVGRPEDMARYEDTGAEVMTVYDAQSKTYDEVYVDMKPSDFTDVERYNTAMYTAASRAKEYSFLTYPEGENITDSSITPEYANNQDKLKEAKTAFVQAKTAELAMIDGMDKGQSIKQTAKDKQVKQEIHDAGKSALDIEAEKVQTEDFPEVVADPVSSSDNSDVQVDPAPEGEVDPQTEQPAEPGETSPALIGTREAVDNVDAEAYPALRDRRIGVGSPTLYLYNKEPNGENAVSIIAQDGQGQWVRIGKIFQEQINNDPRYEDIRKKVSGTEPFYSNETEILNGRRMKDPVPMTPEQLAKHSVREGKIGASQYLRFLYGKGLQGSTNLAADLGRIFREKFYYRSQADKSTKVHFKIFTTSELTDADSYDGTFRPEAGLPYAVIGSDGISYKNAMFVRLQPNRMEKTDDQIVTLKRLADNVEKIQNMTGILMGTKGFNNLIRVFRNSLEIVQENTAEGTVPKVKARTDYTRQEMIANTEEMFDKEGQTGNPNLLNMVPDEKLQDVITAVQDVAMQLYGIKDKEGKFTQAEIDEMGEEWEAVPMNKDQFRKGEKLFYAQLKGETRRKYKRQYRLDSDNGVAQIAFNQIARANEFAGGYRIRVKQHLGRASERHTSYTGKSLMTADGGSSRINELLTLMANNITGPKLVAAGKLSEDELYTKDGLKLAKAEAREMIDNSGQDPITYMQNELLALDDVRVTRLTEEAVNKKETPPVNLDTLRMITADENFDSSGSHMTEERFQVTDKKGQTKSQQTFLRKPLMLDKFNELGSDPVANAEELGRMVNTSFDDIAPTQIHIDFGEVKVQPSEESVNQAPVTTEHHSDIDRQIAEINDKIASEKNPLAKRNLIKQKVELENSRGRMPYDQNSDRPAPGKRINVEKALEDIQRMIPNISPEELVFANKALMSQLANPGEDLLGLFDKGKIYLDTYEGNVYDKVVRHEVMHKIYNEFLSNREKKALRTELDPLNTMNSTQFDEHLADRFMSWENDEIEGRTLSQRVKDIFHKILSWFGFYYGNSSAMKTVFQNVEAGKYSKSILALSDVRRAFSNIKQDFGSVANYKQAVNAVHGMVRDSVMIDNLDVSPITMKEAKEFTKQQLISKKNTLEQALQENTQLVEELKNMNTPEADLAIKEMVDENSDLAAQLSTLKAIFPETEGGNISDKVFGQLWKDMYPNYNFRLGERISSFEEYPEEYTEPDDLNEQQLQDDKDASSLQDFTVQSDERNQEGKVTENVKNFLSFIFRSNGTRINPRYAYLECLRNLNGLVSGEGNLKEQIREAAASNGIDLDGRSDGKRIIYHLLNLIDNATSDVFSDDKGNTVQLPRNMRFSDEDHFYAGQFGADLSTADDFNGATVVRYERRPGESTPAFIRRIADNSQINKRQVIGYFKQAQAQETMREVMSNFLSQRESQPMIAEETREGTMGNTHTVLKYMRAQMFGAERVMAIDIENTIKANWLKIPASVWTNFDASKDDNAKVTMILSALGINKDTKELNLTFAADIAANLRAFKTLVDSAYADGNPKPLKSADDEGLEAERETVQYMDVEYLLSNENSMITNLTKMLSRSSADARPAKYVSVDGRNRYSFFNSSQAIETVQRVINATGKNIKKAAGLPAHLRTAWAKQNIFVEGKINQINSLMDHDGMRKEWGEEFAKGYPDESNQENLQRQFSYGFLAYLKNNTSASDKNLKYVQFFYTISNRPRIIGAEVNVLRPSEIREAAKRMLVQHLEQTDHQDIANYDKYKVINMELLGTAMESVIGKRNAESYTKLLKSPELQEKVIDQFQANLKDLASRVADKMVSERMILGDDASRVASLMKEGKRKYMDPKTETLPGTIRQTRDDIGYTKEQILPLVEHWVANNYVNGYFLNQIPVGNFNYFKSAIDLVKRMSGVFAPGTKGLVDSEGRFFMKPKFKMAIMEDPKMFSDELSAVFKDHQTELYNQAKNDLGKPNLKGDRKEKGFDLADAQGFMLPSRAANIIAGMGQAYNAGAIFKPAHYEVVDRGERGFSPVMMKYSSAVLSDELVQKFPKLLRLRNEMIAKGVDEVVFDSANKVGGPVSSRPVPKLNDFTASEFVIPDSATVDLSNENYRLQLNPKHDTFSNVANPTQLGYFLNVMGKVNPEAGKVNDAAATEVYNAIASLISHGLRKIQAGLNRSGQVTKGQIQRTLTGAGNERIAEMLKDLSYNMPNIADKALIQLMNMYSKGTVKVKFKGGKYVLQSAYGFEMIKKGSERYNALSPEQQKAHDENWSRYGEEERAKIVGQARSLKYGTDEKGRMFAEVLIDKKYADKAKIGDYILPDAMGYRIPSTELHSSVAIKVAGYYDSKGSNVIVAPPELVKQHGSDFDVDSLYVIGRETYEKEVPELGIEAGVPPGYEWDPRFNKFIFNKKNTEDRIPKMYQKAGTDKQLLSQVDKFFEMYQRNRIVENFLDVISHPVNIQRMTEPISVQPITDVLESLKLNFDKQIDLSSPLDNLEVYNSNFQGAKLVGIFANGMKALAYMLKAGSAADGKTEYPQLQKKDDADVPVGVKIGGTVYNVFREKSESGKTIWQILDALVNTAVDNVKEQQLYKINATNSTGNMYVAAQALGIPLHDTVVFMLQPISLLHSKFGGKLDSVKAELVRLYNEKAAVKVNNYPDLAALSSSMAEPTIQSMTTTINADITAMPENGILKQVAMMRTLENLYTLGQDISTFSSAVGIVQDMPVMYEDIQKKADNWAKLGSVDADGNFKTNPDFSFNLDNLFKAQENIAEAYKVFTEAKATAETSFTKHLPAVRAFVDEVVQESGVRLSFKQNVEDIKNELVGYLISSMYSDENKKEAPYTYMYRGAQRIVTGKQAWSQRFIEDLEKEKRKMKAEDRQNSFLNKIGIQSRYGLKTITFATSSNSDYMDNLEMQEAFEQLPSELMKQEFVKYAVMNYGLKFGVKNYSMFIPADYLKPVDQHLKDIDRALRNNKIGEDGKVIEGELKNIKDNFMLRLAVNNADKLPFISSRKMKAIPTPGKTVTVMDITGQPKSIPALNGMDEYYYNRKYSNPLVDDKRTWKASDFPQFIKTSENIALMRLNDPDSDFVYYQRLGMKNWQGGYDASTEALKGNYDLDKYFGQGIIPVPVGDTQAADFQINNEYVNEGSKVIVYGYSNESRDQGRIGIVQTVRTDLTNKAKRTITIKDVDETLTTAQNQFIDRFTPIVNALRTRFKLPMTLVTNENMPTKGVKGELHEGTIYLNLDKMTWDTPFHEVAHPLIAAIKDRNAPWYKNLVKELHDSEHGKEIIEKVKAAYPELDSAGQEVESLVTLLGDLAADRLTTQPTLKSLAVRLYRAIGDIIRAILEKAGVIHLDNLSRDEMASVSLNDLAELLSTKDAGITLDLNPYVRPELKHFSKDLNNDTPPTPPDSVMGKLLEDSSLIVDPELNADGSQSDQYGIRDQKGGPITKYLGRVSSLIAQFSLRKSDLKDKAGNLYPTLTDAIVARESDVLFAGKGSEDKVEIEGIEYTKAEYIDFKKSVYKQGQVKGDLIHALLQFQTAFINEDKATMDALQIKINQLENASAAKPGSYNWVIEKDNFQAIMKNAGINVDKKLPAELRDKVHSEVSVANELIAAGKIDTLVEKPDGRLKVVDYKSGNRFNNSQLGARIMNYGSQEFNIYDSALGHAKLQVMLYSMIIKANHPEAQLEPPMVMHIPNEYKARSQRNAHQVEVRDYLKMVEQYYKNEEPATYKALLEKSPKLFDPAEYGATRNTSFTQDMIDDKTGMRDIEMLTKYEVELEQLVTGISLRGSEGDNYKGQWTTAELKKRDMLMQKIAQARTTLGLPQGSTKDFEIKNFTKWLGTINDTHNPYIQAYAQIVNQARLKVYEEYGAVEAEFNSKLTKVLGKQTGLERAFKPVDKQKLFSRLIHEEIETDPTDGQARVSRGLITERDAGWKDLSADEKDLVLFMRNNMKEVFDHVLVNGPNAVVTTKNGKIRTKLDVYNDSVGAGFKMTNSFIPKMAITSSEVRWKAARNGFEGIKDYVKHELIKRTSMFYEENVEGDNQKQYGIPVKYLGSGSSIHNPDIHTSNLEVAFKGYMQHMINKKYYDSVYAMGDSVKGFLELQKDAYGNLINKNAAEFLGYHMNRNLIGRLNDQGEGFWRKGFRITVSPDGRDINFSPVKFMRTLNSGVAAAALWLKIPAAAKNAGQAMWAVGKESMVNSLSTTEWGGVDIEKQDLSGKNHAKAYGLWMDYQKVSMTDSGRKHPVHVFMKSFHMYPDMTELGTHNRRMVADGGTVWDLNHLSALYAYPEAMTTAVTAMDAMMTMKIQSGPYQGQSMWDVYSNSVVTDPVSGEGKFELPADFTRGKVKMGDGTTQELKGLNFLEVQKLHRIVQRVKGGYRPEERSMIESTALGEMFMLFRRYLPAAIVNGFKAKQYDQSMGFLKKTDQEDVYEWQARMTEGRWRTLAGLIGQYTGIAKRRGYQWSDLSDMQRKNAIDGGFTLSVWALTSALVVAAFGDSDDEDSMKKWASAMNMRLIDQWNFVDWANSATSQPAAVRAALEVLNGSAELGMATAHYVSNGSDDDIYTKRGDLKGENKVLKNLPVSAAIYDAERFIENSDYWSE